MNERVAVSISAFDKLEERLRSKPVDLSISEAERFLKHYGFAFFRQKGSHRIYKGPDGQMLTLQGPIVKEYQIKQILIAVDSI